MIKIKLERDPALVTSPCLRVRTERYDHFVWWAGGPRYLRMLREEDER